MKGFTFEMILLSRASWRKVRLCFWFFIPVEKPRTKSDPLATNFYGIVIMRVPISFQEYPLDDLGCPDGSQVLALLLRERGQRLQLGSEPLEQGPGVGQVHGVVLPNFVPPFIRKHRSRLQRQLPEEQPSQVRRYDLESGERPHPAVSERPGRHDRRGIPASWHWQAPAGGGSPG